MFLLNYWDRQNYPLYPHICYNRVRYIRVLYTNKTHADMYMKPSFLLFTRYSRKRMSGITELLLSRRSGTSSSSHSPCIRIQNTYILHVFSYRLRALDIGLFLAPLVSWGERKKTRATAAAICSVCSARLPLAGRLLPPSEPALHRAAAQDSIIC